MMKNGQDAGYNDKKCNTDAHTEANDGLFAQVGVGTAGCAL
jgi:hypothetical protein